MTQFPQTTRVQQIHIDSIRSPEAFLLTEVTLGICVWLGDEKQFGMSSIGQRREEDRGKKSAITFLRIIRWIVSNSFFSSPSSVVPDNTATSSLAADCNMPTPKHPCTLFIRLEAAKSNRKIIMHDSYVIRWRIQLFALFNHRVIVVQMRSLDIIGRQIHALTVLIN